MLVLFLAIRSPLFSPCRMSPIIALTHHFPMTELHVYVPCTHTYINMSQLTTDEKLNSWRCCCSCTYHKRRVSISYWKDTPPLRSAHPGGVPPHPHCAPAYLLKSFSSHCYFQLPHPKLGENRPWYILQFQSWWATSGMVSIYLAFTQENIGIWFSSDRRHSSFSPDNGDI